MRRRSRASLIAAGAAVLLLGTGAGAAVAQLPPNLPEVNSECRRLTNQVRQATHVVAKETGMQGLSNSTINAARNAACGLTTGGD